MLALKVENVSKQYRLGQVGTGTLTHDLNRLFARMLGREDPYAQVGAVNDREQAGGEYVWALRDVNLEIEQGEIVGIIGRNGAGKSTLLKLLSRVTAPTTGEIKINGRVASLLEVGTGFHPELSGRENIYLNGAILGMTRAEITRRFDEIVDFSGCAKYIDTPVKRYSSGMYVRLAFAVAAHLESDILIVDEVLAVGDAEFQAKCVGKMQDVSRRGGRTVLFVSHNMSSVRQLCPRSVLLERGSVSRSGQTEAIVQQYLSKLAQNAEGSATGLQSSNDEIALLRASTRGSNDEAAAAFSTADDVHVTVRYELRRPIRNLRTIIKLSNREGIELLHTSGFRRLPPGTVHEPGIYKAECVFPGNLLNVGTYYVEVVFDVPSFREVLRPAGFLQFSIVISSFDQTGVTYDALGAVAAPGGLIHPDLDWTLSRVA